MKTLGIVLVAAGILALVYQGFTYKKPEEVAKIGSLEVTSEKHEYVWIPPLIGVVVLVSGIALIVLPSRNT